MYPSIDLHSSSTLFSSKLGQCRNREGVCRCSMDAKVEEADEEVLARAPVNLGENRDLDHVLGEGFDRCLRTEAVVECSSVADNP